MWIWLVEMNVWIRQLLGALQRLRGAADVALGGARERRDHRTAHAGRDLGHRVELAFRRDREAGLQDVHVQPRELLGDLDLLGARERDAGRLLAVPQGRVEDPYGVAVGYVAFLHSGTTFVVALQPGHHLAQAPSHVFELGRARLAPKSEEVGESAVGLRDPFLGELPALDLVEDPAHLGAGLVVDHPRSTRVVAVLGRVGDGVAHPRQAALVDQVHDQLQLVQALEVRDLRLVPGRDERLEPRLDQRRRAAAQHRLLAEEVGLGLLLERGLEHAGARGTDAGRVRERALPGLPGRVLVHGDERRRPDALLVRPAHQVTGPLRRDHRDVHALGRRDRAEVDVEPVREHQHVAGLEVRPDVVGVRLGLRRVGQDHHDDVGLADGVGRVEHAQARVLGDLARLRTGTQTDADVVPGVAQVQRVRVSLAAEPEDRDLLPLRARPRSVSFS